MNRRRATAVVLVLFTLSALVAWWLVRDDADVAVPRPRGESLPASAPTSPPPPAPAKRTRAAPGAPPETDEETAVPIAEEPDGSPLFPTVAVEVRHADGSPAPRATVYALRSGGSADDGPAATSRLDNDGACVLRLPGPGVYDFGADTEDDLLSALVTEVNAATTPRVRLELPATAEIELDADETVPRGTLARLRIVGDARDRGFDASHLPISLTAPAGARFRLRCASAEFRFVPDRVTAPGSATLRRDGRGRIRLLVTVVPQDRVARHDAILHTEFVVDGGGAADPWDDLSRDWIAESGVRLSDTFHSRPEWVKSAPAPRGTLRWSGAGIAPGSVGFDAPDGETVDVPVTLRLDDTLPGESECAVTIEGPADARGLTLWVLSPDGLGSEGYEALIGAQIVESPPTWPTALVYATADGLASAAAPFDATRPLVLTLRPAGRVRVIRGILPPDGIDLVLRRRDHGPLPFGEFPGNGQQVTSLVFNEPSFVVGPLAEGDVTFVVSCAGRDLAEVTAHVVAGRTIDVRLPLAERLAAAKR